MQKLNTMRRSMEEEEAAALEAMLEGECEVQTPGHGVREGEPRKGLCLNKKFTCAEDIKQRARD